MYVFSGFRDVKRAKAAAKGDLLLNRNMLFAKKAGFYIEATRPEALGIPRRPVVPSWRRQSPPRQGHLRAAATRRRNWS